MHSTGPNANVRLALPPLRFFALTSFRLLFLLASGTAVFVCLDTWKNKIWPLIKGAKNVASLCVLGLLCFKYNLGGTLL